MSAPAAPAAETTPLCPGQVALFPGSGTRVVITYARPDGGPLTDADFDHLAQLAHAASGTPTRPTGGPGEDAA
ncbi:hypothetical protein M1P56_35650 (plasmid) [Streptomyces sp. HU2014]|uniref:hypothetical protein n=1 Tax=Streptomyces sp. HU2014 TaxID=2939414 RepID=UPI00200DB2A4|nr:hypothetical protein [Streptomyces sp. HU2014]UQI49827.1 hypothetical protein M1P56_35650 [Streptomyces sp. HU2014]